jgi:hypothetical protein
VPPPFGHSDEPEQRRGRQFRKAPTLLAATHSQQYVFIKTIQFCQEKRFETGTSPITFSFQDAAVPASPLMD